MDSEPIAVRDFPNTQWAMIRQAGSSEAAIQRRAIDAFCKTYWMPLFAFAKRRGFADMDAEDVTQEFLVDLLDRGDLNQTAPEHGKLRMFLFRTMANFMNNEWDKRATIKRGGRVKFVSLNHGGPEVQHLNEIASETTAEPDFDRHWVLAMLTQVLDRLRANYEGRGKGELFEALRVYLTLDGDDGQPYAVVADELDMSEDAVKTAVGRLRKRYRELVREEVLLTLDEGDNPDVEIDYLIGVLTS